MSARHAHGSAGAAAPVGCVDLRADGRRLAGGGPDGAVSVWDTTDPARIVRLAVLPHPAPTASVAWNPAAADLLVTGSQDGSARVWRVVEGRPPDPMTELRGHSGGVSAVTWTPDGQHVVCLTRQGQMLGWNGLTGVRLADLGPGTAAAVSLRGLLAVVTQDALVSVEPLDQSARRLVRSLASPAEQCLWSPDGSIVAVARDSMVELFTAGLQRIRGFPADVGGVRSLAWSDDGTTLLIGGYDKVLQASDLHGRPLWRRQDDALWPRSLSTHGDVVAAAAFEGVRLFDLHTGVPIDAPAAWTDRLSAFASHRGSLIVGCASGAVLSWNMAAPAPAVRRLARADDVVTALAADDDAVYAGTGSGQILRHDPRRGPDAGATTTVPVRRLCRTADVLLAMTSNGDLAGFDAGTLRRHSRGVGSPGAVTTVSPFRGGVLTAAPDRTLAAGHLGGLRPLWRHATPATAVATAHGRVVASVSRRAVRLLLLDTAGTKVERFLSLASPEPVQAVAILGSVDRPVVIGGAYDFSLYAWHVDWATARRDVADARVVGRFPRGFAALTDVDSHRAVAAGRGGELLMLTADDRGGVHASWLPDLDEVVAGAGVTDQTSSRTNTSASALAVASGVAEGSMM